MTGLWRLWALGGGAATALYLIDLSPAVNSVCALIIGAGTVAACFTGPRRLHAEPRRAWLLIGLAALGFRIGMGARPSAPEAGLPLIADCFTVPGYLLLLGFFWTLLR